MTTHSLQIEYPDELLRSVSEAQPQSMAREALYAHLYAHGLLSSGRAAGLLGITRWDFLDLLGRYGVSSFDDQLDRDEPGIDAHPSSASTHV